MGTLSRNGFKFNLGNYDQIVADVPKGPSQLQTDTSPSSNGSETQAVPCDYFEGVYEYIRQMLMEEDDLEYRPCMFQESSALQAAEKYFYDALSDNSPTQDECAVNNNDTDHHHHHLEFNHHYNPDPSCKSTSAGFGQWSAFETSQMRGFSCDFDRLAQEEGFPESPVDEVLSSNLTATSNGNVEPNQLTDRGKEKSTQGDGHGRKKGRGRGESNGEGGEEEHSKNKHLAGCADDESVQMEKYDKSLLCPKMNPRFYNDSSACNTEEKSDTDDEEEDKINKQYRESTQVKRGRPKGSKKNAKVREVVDLRSLLTRCAQAVLSFNTRTADDCLKQIRKHSSPYGDGNERLAHCFANALEARMAGTGSALYTAFASKRIPAAELLKSYQSYVTACPFKRMSNIFANKSIAKYAGDADKIHIIDFGILYGFQWPCIIHGISLRPGGPPLLKITGIDFPQPGFRPAERVEQTGNRLVNFCKRFNVPFEYNAVAKKWDEIRVEDLKIEKDEMVVVNCLYRLRHVPDESAGVNSPRDAVLRLIKKIKPDLFVHGVVNGTYNATFFGTRFQETLYHYSSFFDMMEATLPREDQDRLLYEREVFGRDVMNMIACEGSERIERPETYKQWQVRNQRAGFRQLPLNREILTEVKTKVFKGYHNDFLLDEDSEWLLQGWKGRVMYALSCWKPS